MRPRHAREIAELSQRLAIVFHDFVLTERWLLAWSVAASNPVGATSQIASEH
jgi:hypothetical protein